MRTAALLVLLAIAALAFAVLPPAFEFAQRVRKASETELVCLDPRIASAMQAAISRSPHGMPAANIFLQHRLFERPDNHISTLMTEVVRAKLGGLIVGPRRTASAVCSHGYGGGARSSLPHFAFLLGIDDLAHTDDCRLNALADYYLSSTRPTDPGPAQAFAARTKACPSR